VGPPHQPDQQRPDGQRDHQPGQQPPRSGHRPGALGPDQLGLEQHLAGGVGAARWDEHVAGPGGEEVGHVEPGRTLDQARHALLEQQALDELGLGLVAGAGRPHERSFAELGLDLAGAPVALRGDTTSLRVEILPDER
jgi:hypothetical protein